MKKIGWTILVGLLTMVSIHAQKTVPNNEKESVIPKNNIKLHPLNALAGIIGIGYERVIKPKTSINFSLFQQFDEPNFENNVFEKNYQMLFETALRYYISKQKKAPEGLFLSGGLFTEYNYNKYKSSTNNEVKDVERLWIGGSTRIGHQWIFKNALKGISTELAGGVAYKTITGIFEEDTKSEFYVQLEFTIGYSW